MSIDPAPCGYPQQSGQPEPGSGAPPSQASPLYSIARAATEQGLAALQADWNRLSETAGSPNVFTTFDWFRVWNQPFARQDRSGRRRLEVLALRNKNGAIAGVSPLIHRETSRLGFVVRKVEFLEIPADYNDFVLGDDPAGQSEAIVDFLVQTQEQWDLIDLRSLRETGNVKAQIESALSRTSLLYRILPEAPCPYLPIDGPWSGMVRRLSRSARRTLRNQQYRLDRMSAEGLRIRIIDRPRDEAALLEKLIAVKSQKRVRGELIPPFVARYPEVFHSLFDTLGSRGWIYVALMELGGPPLAWQLGFRCGRILWDFSTAYDHSFARLSPGTMLVPAILDYGFSHGYSEYDFLRGEEAYEMRWSTGSHQTFRLLIWSRRWSSRARAFVYLDFKRAVYRLFGRTS